MMKRQGFPRMLNTILKKAASLIRQLFTKESSETPESIFLREWTNAFSIDAAAFNGLYTGLIRVREGKTKRAAQHLAEWTVRVHYKWGGQPIDTITRQCLVPAMESSSMEDCRKWTEILLRAAADAGVRRDDPAEITLDEASVNAYQEWDGKELYLGDRVRVTVPAWRQNGRGIEQGYCLKLEEEGEQSDG